MTPLWTVSEIVAATGGRPEGLLDGPVSSVSIDSRDLGPEALFVAIKGEQFDGHDFVGAARDAGAVAALVSEAHFAAHGGERLIVVPDPLAALSDLGRAARARSKAQIVAVTGSAGKTTTKEAIRTALTAAGTTHASIRSFNNHWGVPLMLARLPREAQFGVFEIGMNHKGEITPLTRLVRPHVALVTTVAAAHLEFFASVAEIAEAKAEIFVGLEPGGTALLNTDHDYLHILFHLAREAGVGRIVTYGFDESADWRIEKVSATPGGSVARVRHEGRLHELVLQVPGRHMVANAVAALAVAHCSGEGTATALEALRSFGAPEGRGETTRLGPDEKPLLLVDESYNANLASMAAALEVYAGISPPGGAKVLVLADMLELGPQSPTLHATLAPAVRASGADRVYLIGPSMAALAEALGDVAGHAESLEGLAETILSSLAYGDAVMVKGSKGMQLANLVRKIRERFQ
ncbi:MAG TPA: UDP-N-acetylmuramoyl-tripeptide--D-alanyl-D-alanine ligase [Devosiaceae bacterium]|nr:UDP-N-acetylmuramoyl-tripeptide--D-alanyl-D-alanine ligase [Devosiaceae bacterium]